MKKENILIAIVTFISFFLFYKIIVVKISHKIKSYPRNIKAEFYLQQQDISLKEILEKNKIIINQIKNFSNTTGNDFSTHQINEIKKKINTTEKETFFLDKIFFQEHKYLVDELLSPTLKRYQSNYYIFFQGKIKIEKEQKITFRVDSNKQPFSFQIFNEEKKSILKKQEFNKNYGSRTFSTSFPKGIYSYQIYFLQKKSKKNKFQITYWEKIKSDSKKEKKMFGKNKRGIYFIR